MTVVPVPLIVMMVMVMVMMVVMIVVVIIVMSMMFVIVIMSMIVMIVFPGKSSYREQRGSNYRANQSKLAKHLRFLHFAHVKRLGPNKTTAVLSELRTAVASRAKIQITSL